MDAKDQFPNVANLDYLEELYGLYLEDRNAVLPVWQAFFDKEQASHPRPPLRPAFMARSIFHPKGPANPAESTHDRQSVLQDRLDQLLRAYRVRGHRVARVDPLNRPIAEMPELDPAFYGFTEADLDRRFSVDTMPGRQHRTLREILDHLRDTYCRDIGAQFMHIDDVRVRSWLRERMEATANHLELTREQQVQILKSLTDAVSFEEFVQKKFLGAKSFSLEGAETLIPLLWLAIEKAGDQNVDEIVLGMAHRGRLNVLANIMGKSPQQIFLEFEDKVARPGFGGDVKYHLGHSRDWVSAAGRTVHLSLCFNPSHLEYVNPVALGRIRAKQDRVQDADHRRGLAILIHGDAAFIGEGVVQESLNLSELEPYKTGGTLHIVVNNQIGFTTPAEEGRSSTYATDVAKMLQIPIFHVNGEQPEAVAQVVQLAMDFRETFRRDVVIDMYCYRRRGHNETDEPTFTQPLMYRAIDKNSGVREGYLDHLLRLGGISRDEADRIDRERRDLLELRLAEVRQGTVKPNPDPLHRIWDGYHGGPAALCVEPETGISAAESRRLLLALNQVPSGFQLHPKLQRFFRNREEMAEGIRRLDWGAAESLAFAATLVSGRRIRFTGQDVGRGTFSHRHAVLHDFQKGMVHVPLAHIQPGQGPITLANSPLSEVAVLGFEYGYSLDCPDGLVVWEAQFGDFINCAQVIIDQFVASAEDKWSRLSGLVILLPHGFEGQGPEHSSARLERFLMMAAEDNIQVVYPTTPAQMFHLLYRQALLRWKKPLVVMTPKSLLRHPKCTSSLDEFSAGRFMKVIADNQRFHGAAIRRVLLCTGKIYWELVEEREIRLLNDVAIVRLEQLYPLPERELEGVLMNYAEGTEVIWVQEEPENMGAWRYLRVRFLNQLFGRFPFSGIYREASASPASGSAATHKAEQLLLLERSLSRSQ